MNLKDIKKKLVESSKDDILPEPFTAEEAQALIEVYGNQFYQNFQSFKKAVYTFSFYKGAVPANASNYDELLKEVKISQTRLKEDAQRFLEGEIISLGEVVDE